MTFLRCVGLVLAGLVAVPLTGSLSTNAVASPVLLADARPQVKKADTSSAKKQPVTKAKPKAKPATATKKPVKVTKTSKRKKADAIAAPLPKAKLDLSLPPDMAKEMKPVEQIEAEVRKPLLPAMFGDKPESQSPFQLNGRLLSNEMQLQLRNDSRQQEIEGAAIDFEFKQ